MRTPPRVGTYDAHEWTPVFQTDAVLNCADNDPEMFFEPDHYAAARRVCMGCDVREQCLQWALAATPHVMGVFGGTTEWGREKIRAETAEVVPPEAGAA